MSPYCTFFSLDQVFDQVNAINYRDLFNQMAPLMGGVCQVPPPKMLHCLLERERLGSTYWGQGVAIPHGTLPDLSSPYIFLARLTSSFSYSPPQSSPVDLVCFLWVPTAMESYGHQLLLKISRLLKNENLCLHLRQAATQEELYHVFMEGMQTPLSIAA